MSWLFESCGQSTGASASVLPMNIQGIRNSMPPKSKESLLVRCVVEGTDRMWSDDRKPQIQPRTLELTLWGTPLEVLESNWPSITSCNAFSTRFLFLSRSGANSTLSIYATVITFFFFLHQLILYLYCYHSMTILLYLWGIGFRTCHWYQNPQVFMFSSWPSISLDVEPRNMECWLYYLLKKHPHVSGPWSLNLCCSRVNYIHILSFLHNIWYTLWAKAPLPSPESPSESSKISCP